MTGSRGVLLLILDPTKLLFCTIFLFIVSAVFCPTVEFLVTTPLILLLLLLLLIMLPPLFIGLLVF